MSAYGLDSKSSPNNGLWLNIFPSPFCSAEPTSSALKTCIVGLAWLPDAESLIFRACVCAVLVSRSRLLEEGARALVAVVFAEDTEQKG
jgi:hypothetical protein